MLSFNVVVSGGQVANEMANDEEELAEFLKNMAGFEGSQFDEVAEYMSDEERGAAVVFLRSLADTIEAAE